LNAAIGGGADIAGYFIGGILVSYLGLKRAFLVSWSIAAISGFSLSLFEFKSGSLLIAGMILGARLGVSGAFGLSYLGTVEAIPPLLVSSIFGACSTMARFSTILAPEVAKV